MNILFVDDEQLILDGISRSLFDTEWDVECANSGAEALEKLKATHFDVIVSDMRMPEMDGAELLDIVAQDYPEMVRLILSGHSERSIAMQSSFIAHRWLDKPFGPDELIEILIKVESALKHMPNETVKTAVCQISSLPSPPKIYARIQSLIQSGAADLEKVADIIEEDPSLSVKVLQITNSAMFSRGDTTSDVHKAVVRLGTEMVTDFVLFSETYSFASGCTLIDMEKLVKASFAISRLGAAMAREILPDKVAEVKLAGLLCEIGQSVLIQAFPDKAQDYLDRIAYADEAETLAIEMELFTASDEQVGAFLLMFWGFSTDIIDGVLYSRLPEKALSPGHNVAALVYVARLIYKGISIDEQTISRLGIEEHLPKWNEMATRLKGA